MGRLEGKVAVITGGSSGIGAATARLFLEEGARVVIADILDEPGQALAREFGDGAVFQHTNVFWEKEIQEAINLAFQKFGKLDCMFNNAGITGVGGPIENTDTEAFDVTVAVLFRSVMLGMKHAARVMIPQGYGNIISTASDEASFINGEALQVDGGIGRGFVDRAEKGGQIEELITALGFDPSLFIQ